MRDFLLDICVKLVVTWPTAIPVVVALATHSAGWSAASWLAVMIAYHFVILYVQRRPGK